MNTAGAAGCGNCRPHGNPLQSQRLPTVAWKPSAPTTSHSLDGGITYKPLTRGWVLFTLSKRLCAAFDERGAVQSSLIGAELALKAALAGKGVNEAALKNYRHNLDRLVKAVGNLYGSFELASVMERMRLLPNLVDNRYSSEQPSRMETGAIVMAGQYIAGAVARAVSGGSCRAKLEQ